MVDMVVRRGELRDTLVRILALLRDRTPSAEVVPIKGDGRKAAARKPAAVEGLPQAESPAAPQAQKPEGVAAEIAGDSGEGDAPRR
jgi:acetyl-CoA carboxylase carboxyl transferase subunit beta